MWAPVFFIGPYCCISYHSQNSGHSGLIYIYIIYEQVFENLRHHQYSSRNQGQKWRDTRIYINESRLQSKPLKPRWDNRPNVKPILDSIMRHQTSPKGDWKGNLLCNVLTVSLSVFTDGMQGGWLSDHISSLVTQKRQQRFQQLCYASLCHTCAIRMWGIGPWYRHSRQSWCSSIIWMQTSHRTRGWQEAEAGKNQNRKLQPNPTTMTHWPCEESCREGDCLQIWGLNQRWYVY